MCSSLQKSFLSFILQQFYRQGEEIAKNEFINQNIVQDSSLFNRRNLEYLTKGFSNFAIQQIGAHFEGVLIKNTNEIKRLI